MSVALFKELTELPIRPFADCPLGKMTQGKVFDKPMSEYDKPLNLSDDNGNKYIMAGNLLPNTTYILNENIYTTNENGQIIRCESTPKLTPENPRDNGAQTSVGGENRRSDDQGGHIVGRDIGGDGGLGNLVPMDSRINQSDYKRMENDLKNDLSEGKVVTVKTELEYSANSERPDKLYTTVTTDGKETVYTFDNNLDGSLIDKLQETCTESDIGTVNDILDETGGEISSTKENFDSNGTLEKTTVRITYVDENGENKRTQVLINNNRGDSQ